MNEHDEAIRAAFEAWADAPPFEWNLSRRPMDERVTGWPGAYVDYHVCCAWDAYRADLIAGMRRAAEIAHVAQIGGELGERADLAIEQAALKLEQGQP